MKYRTGIHTVEIKTSRYINDRELLHPIIGKRYKLNVEARDEWRRYQTPAYTDRIIHDVLEEIGEQDMGMLMRADYRLDNYTTSYEDELCLMRAIVHIIAHKTNQTNRIQYTAHDAAIITHSIRCMPDDRDEQAMYGIEYYDKRYQRGNAENGNARLELRSLNMHGGSVTDALNSWKMLLSGVTRDDYMDMLKIHASSLKHEYSYGENCESFMKRMMPMLIGREEEFMLRRLIGSKTHKRKGTDLTGWRDIQDHLVEIIRHIDADLNGKKIPQTGEDDSIHNVHGCHVVKNTDSISKKQQFNIRKQKEYLQYTRVCARA